MKKFILTLALFSACCALVYSGPEPIASKEIAPVPPPPSCFEGWYFGVHGGGILTEFDPRTSAFEDTEAPRGGGFSESAFAETGRRGSDSTWEGGLHAGYNWQRGSWVFGLEVDIQGSNFERQDSALAFINLPTDEDDGEADHQYSTEIHSTTKLNWYSTGRIRIGHTLGDRIMVFATGGGAVGSTEVSESTAVVASTTEGGTTSAFLTKRDSGIRGGWTAGAGFDFCLSQHWILNFTYLYVDLGDASASSTALLTLPAPGSGGGVRTFDSETRARADFQFHVFQGGLTFKF